MEIDVTKILTELLIDACRNSLEEDKFGSRGYHIESIFMDNETSPWEFTVKYWEDESMRPSKVKYKLDYFQTIDMLTRAISRKINVADFAEFTC